MNRVISPAPNDPAAGTLEERLRGLLRPDGRLPSERRLAEALGESRFALRAALAALAGAGLPGPTEADRDRTVAVFLEGLARGRAELVEILEVRRLLEPAIAGMAARKAAPADLAQLRMLLACQRREVASGGTGRDADAAFHASLARIAGNSLLLDMVEDIAGRLAETREAFLLERETHRMAALVAHEAVLEAVASADAPAAERAMRDHLDRMAPGFLAWGQAGLGERRPKPDALFNCSK
ncbi:FCD domain-containing protein [Desulfovibrio aminophilus]|nr:FCD domain-containing protein [Desulfovibrio aminophilus]MCM0755500.1 FCD domain-containing protein [Desulfovibrio aminophilus]